jgi:hypothetical protein
MPRTLGKVQGQGPEPRRGPGSTEQKHHGECRSFRERHRSGFDIGRDGTESKIKRSDDQIRDLASNILCAKSISDLEKPGARNLIRSEMLSVFNTALGNGVVQELYLTDFAVQ